MASLFIVLPALAEDPGHVGHGEPGHTHAPPGAAVPADVPVGGAPAGVAAHEGAAEAGAAHGGGETHGANPVILTMQAIALVVFVAILLKLAYRPLSDATKNRAAKVHNDLEEARRIKAEANARSAEIEARLAALDAQLVQMRVDAEAEANAEARQIALRADADIARVKDTAERTVREEVARARGELRNEAVSLAVELARTTLTRSVTAADQERLAGELLASVGAAPGSPDLRKSPSNGEA